MDGDKGMGQEFLGLKQMIDIGLCKVGTGITGTRPLLRKSSGAPA
jgi:hypothetical protein